MRVIIASLVSLTLLTACGGSTDPNTAEYWIDRLDQKGERKEAHKQIGKIGVRRAHQWKARLLKVE